MLLKTMKFYSNIKHKHPKTSEFCDRNLDKEFWGEGWMNMTCMKCGFSKVVSEETYLKWQYCDVVIEEGGDKK